MYTDVFCGTNNIVLNPVLCWHAVHKIGVHYFELDQCYPVTSMPAGSIQTNSERQSKIQITVTSNSYCNVLIIIMLVDISKL